jgi:Ca2+-binding RTX toxin-like protein
MTAAQLDQFNGTINTGAITLSGAGAVDISDGDVSTAIFNLSNAGNSLKLTNESLAHYVVNGGDAADTVTIVGGSFGASIFGGDGNDVLTGGSGADKFIYTTDTSGVDTITNFSGQAAQGDDLVFDNLLTGTFSYIGSGVFTGGSDNTEARFQGGQVFMDTDGDGVSNITITLTGITTAAQLNVNDFVFI